MARGIWGFSLAFLLLSLQNRHMPPIFSGQFLRINPQQGLPCDPSTLQKPFTRGIFGCFSWYEEQLCPLGTGFGVACCVGS